jgi:DNA-directed RNA polymerase specialized sigma24 family protein
MEPRFDLDVTPEHPVDDAVVDSLDYDELVGAISRLPLDLRAPMGAIVLEKRTYSDVSQELGIRQAELVRAVQRGRALIARSRG